jgi:hypothetical protein
MTPDKVDVVPYSFSLYILSTDSWDHYKTRPNNYYEFCSVILIWTVTKTPPTYDTRLSVMPWMNEVRTKIGRDSEGYVYNLDYNW